MRVDIGNCLDTVATPGVPRTALERLDERVGAAHERIERGMADEEFGYAALGLPDRVDPAEIRATIDPVADVDTLLVVGIGGSGLGAATITAAVGDDDTVHVLDNVDPDHVSSLLETLDLARTGLHVVSRSGKTTETLANFLVVRSAYERAGIDWTDRTVVTTGPDGPLRALARTEGLPVLNTPVGVPGRFAALSTVALPAAIAAGVDVEALLDGAAAERDRLSGSLFECPAYAYAAACYALQMRGITVNAVMPYAERLERFAEWVAQLWAESLGKDGLGQTPVRALGATDQHSQLQLYRSGPRTTMVSFVHPTERAEVPLPSTDIDALSYLDGTTLGELIHAELRATEGSLAVENRPSVRIEIDRLDARGLGELLWGFQAATVMAGELVEVEPFTQPAVEWGKRATRGLLGDGGREATAVEEKTTLWID